MTCMCVLKNTPPPRPLPHPFHHSHTLHTYVHTETQSELYGPFDFETMVLVFCSGRVALLSIFSIGDRSICLFTVFRVVREERRNKITVKSFCTRRTVLGYMTTMLAQITPRNIRFIK